MSAEDFRLIDTEKVDDSIIKQDFIKNISSIWSQR